MELKFAVKGPRAAVEKVADPDREVEIPEWFGGLPVAELGAYAFCGSAVEEVRLPAGMVKIGAYAFYGCASLKRLYLYSRLSDFGTGVFAGARSVEFLDITECAGERSGFKDLLSELRQTLRVRLHLPDGSEARLIFPEYFEEWVENTPARMLYNETHGCGHRYRYCFVSRVFQYGMYDGLFPFAKVEESSALAAELALGRLLYPAGLAQKHRDMYMDYIRENWQTAALLCISADKPGPGRLTNLEPGTLAWLDKTFPAESGEAGRERLGKLLPAARQEGDLEMVSWIMERRRTGRAAGGMGKRRFEL